MFEGAMFISPAYAQTVGAAEQGGGSFLLFLPYLALIPIFYFLVLRPQQRRQRALQDALGGIKKGDSVVTAGGVLGKVTRVEDAVVEVEIAANTRIRVVKATIAEVTPLGAKPAND